MLVSLYTGSLSAKVCAGMLKFRKLFKNNKAEFNIDQKGIDEWTKNQRERFQKIQEDFGTQINSGIVEGDGSGRTGYFAAKDG